MRRAAHRAANFSAGAVSVQHVAYAQNELNLAPAVDIDGVIALQGRLMDEATFGADAPPLMIVHGEDDRVFPISSAIELQGRAQLADVSVQFFPLADTSHGIKNVAGRSVRVSGRPVSEHAVQFLQQAFGATGQVRSFCLADEARLCP